MKSAPEQDDFDATAKEWIDLLREPKSREIMSFDDFETLDEAIKDFFNTENLEEQVTESIENSKKYNYYGRLISAIALKLVQKYGLGNLTIANLRISDLHMEDRILNVNGFRLPLTEDIISNFELYLKVRNSVIKNNDSETDILFITREGTPHLNKNSQAENGKLFSLMKDTLHHTRITALSYRTIVGLVSKGANINLLSNLTGTVESTIAKIYDYDSEEREKFEDIFEAVHESHRLESTKHPKGLMQCPYCGDYKDASSENWILIQVVGDDKKHLACRECRGLDGKYRY